MNTHTNVRSIVLSVLGVLAVVTLLGVSDSQATAASESNQALLSHQVRHELVTLPWYGVFDNLEYTVSGNEVKLTGQVVNPVMRSDAEAAVRRLAGVTRVEDDIKVLPLSVFDDQIRRAEFRTIFSQPALSRYAMGVVPTIHIIVDSGQVTLEGVVDNEMDRNIAGIRANSVPNVFSVTNNLRVG